MVTSYLFLNFCEGKIEQCFQICKVCKDNAGCNNLTKKLNVLVVRLCSYFLIVNKNKNKKQKTKNKKKEFCF